VSDYSLMTTEKQRLILQCAMQLFAAQGYAGTSTSSIAKAAGVSEGLIFRHFGAKEGLLRAIMEEGMTQIALSMSAYSQRTPLQEGSLIAQHVRSAFVLLRENETFWRLAQQLRFQQSVQQSGREAIEQVNRLVMETLSEHFRGQGAVDPEAEAELLFAIIDGVTIHYLQDPKGYPLQRIESLILAKYHHETR
jgi:AcrR family transcriptional regulator